MKKTHKILLAAAALFLLLVLAAAAVFVSNVKTAKTPDDMIGLLRKSLQLAENDGSSISYIGEFVEDETALLWFSFQNGYLSYYRVVECRQLKNGGYLVKHIHTPMTYAQDIVHIVWMAKDVFLINNPNCQAVIYSNDSGNIISKTELSSSDLPYVFHQTMPAKATTCDFVDAEGNSIR